MEIFSWEDEAKYGNFGDDLNNWLWDELLPGIRGVEPGTLLVGVGTVLNAELLPQTQKKLVIGSGYGYGDPPDMLADKRLWDIRCVRGPKTAIALGLDEDYGILDPAMLVADMPEFVGAMKMYRVGFVPHWDSHINGHWETVCRVLGIHYINPCGEAKKVIKDIAACEKIVAESMHGAIFADAFRTPWVAVRTSEHINRFKWEDWAQTVGAKYDPKDIHCSTRTEAIKRQRKIFGIRFRSGTRSSGTRDYPATTGNFNAKDESSDSMRVSGLRRRLKQAVKLGLAVPAMCSLWSASRDCGQLGDKELTKVRKDQLARVLEGVKRDYGLTG